MNLCRYVKSKTIRSVLDPFGDVINLIRYLTSSEYLQDVIASKHGMSPAEARGRVKQMLPYIETGLRYVEQTLAGPQDLAFLPAYYAILNFMKVYVLLGPLHKSLEKQRYHGVAYTGIEKDAHGLMTDEVTVKQGGAFPLFYQTVTGKQITTKRPIQPRDFCPYLMNVGAEYELAEHEACDLSAVGGTFRKTNQGHRVPHLRFKPWRTYEYLDRRKLKLLNGEWKRASSDTISYSGSPVPQKGSEGGISAREQLNTYMLYHRINASEQTHLRGETPVCGGPLDMFEEVPIILFFFHMSSVVRYKPRFLRTLQESRHWPIIAAARRHCLLKFLVLFWSYVHQTALCLHHG